VRQKDTHSNISTSELPLAATKPTALLDLEQFRARLAQFADATGGKAELARRLGVTGQFIGYVIAGQRKPGQKLLAALGARRRVMIEFEVEAE
jgi:hypothetical protein